MSRHPIDYGVEVPRVRWRLPRRGWFVGVPAATLLALAAFFGSRDVRTDIDTVTATTVTRTRYPFGITLGPPEVDTSEVEQRMRKIGAPWTPRWRFLHDQEHSWFGLVVARGCGSTPPSYQLKYIDGPFLAGLTNAEVVALVRVLETGTPAEQKDAIQAIFDTIGSRGPSVPGGAAAAATVPAPAVSAGR